MRLENILALTHGELVNSPFVNKFENIVYDSKNVKRGDLFIAFDEEMIEEAILNGAYGVIFEKPTQISDTEIAWIKVRDLNEALKKVLRFKLIDKNITVYQCDEVTLKLALQIPTESIFIPLSGTIQDIFKKLANIENNTILLFSPTITTSDIFTNIQKLPTFKDKIITITEQTLFETSFVYKGTFYERQLISPIFITNLEKILFLLEKLNINFRLKKFNLLDNFEPVFINNNLDIKEFGSTDKVLIFEKNLHLIEKEIDFLKKHATWAKVIYVTPPYIKLNEKYQKIYRSKNNITKILKNENFHFALIIGVDKEILKDKTKSQIQKTLFDF